jgi:hypothetical protein
VEKVGEHVFLGPIGCPLSFRSFPVPLAEFSVRRNLLFALFFLAAASASVAGPGTEEEFAAGLAEVRTLMKRNFWGPAEKKLTALLVAHRERAYVYAKRAEIEERAATCAFRQSWLVPRTESLISGRLLTWNDASCSLKIKYDPGRMGDFEERNGLYHAARFSGPYSIEIRGSHYPGREEGKSPGVIVCLEGEDAFFVSCGLDRIGQSSYLPATIQRMKDGRWEVVASGDAPPPVKAGRPFVLKITVGRTEIAARYGGKLLVEALKPGTLFGSFGFQHLPFDEILLQGKADPGWIRGLVDEARQKARAAFNKTWSSADRLPGWLLAGKNGGVPKKDTGGRRCPGKPFPGMEAVISKAIGFYNDERHDEGLAYVRGLGSRRISVAGREYFSALFLEGKRDYESALARCEKACLLDGEFFETLWLRATLNVRLKRRVAAIGLLRRLVDRSPAKACVPALLARLLLDKGELDEAQGIVERAFRRGVGGDDLEKIARTLVKARNGPGWDRAFENRSLHYHVRSDIDYRTCLEASKILEESHAAFAVYLEPAVRREAKRFSVYIFSSQAGYRAYFEGLQGKTPALSSGVYLPALKQLLIWNLPSRKEWERTVRHEGFHQYLDRLVDDPPVWFNEGLAVCFELAEHRDGKWHLGTIHPVHAKVLADAPGGGKGRLPPLDRFLYMDFDAFHENARLHYAEAWAFVHFLRQGTLKRRDLFQRFFTKLKSGGTSESALRQVFSPSVLSELQAEFDLFVRSLK